MRHMSHVTKSSWQQLTRREREIMDAVFALGNRASAEDIRARLVDPPGDSSVRVMLMRLERKGFVRHTEEGVR
jgi:BlaI family transcriptional regulator, penicillinase repressor